MKQEEKMEKINKERREMLKMYNISILRELGRNLGLRMATELSKDRLIDEILNLLYGDEELPIEEEAESVEELPLGNDQNTDYSNDYSYGYFELSSIAKGKLCAKKTGYDIGEKPKKDPKDIKQYKGYIDNKNGSFKIVYAREFYLPLSETVIEANNLKPYDEVTFTAYYNVEENQVILLEILEINGVKKEELKRTDFEVLKQEPPTELFKIGGGAKIFNLISKVCPIVRGARVLISGKETLNSSRLLDEIYAGLEENNEDVLYIQIDKNKDTKEIVEQNYKNAFVIENGKMAEDKLKEIIEIILRAERKVEVGGNVILIIDNLSRVYECLESLIDNENSSYIATLVNRLFCLGGKFNNGGSLTIITQENGENLKVKEWLKRSSTLYIPLNEELDYPSIDIKNIEKKLEKFYMDEENNDVAQNLKLLVESKIYSSYEDLIKRLMEPEKLSDLLNKI